MENKIFSKGFFKYIVEDGKLSFCSYHGFKKLLTIPETLGGYPVIGIWGGVFCNCKRLVEVIIPSSITTIREMSFWGCKNLKRVEIPDSVTTIENKAFSDCKSLVEVIIPNSVISIDDEAFDGDVTIVGEKKSYAHDYAISMGIYFRVR